MMEALLIIGYVAVGVLVARLFKRLGMFGSLDVGNRIGITIFLILLWPVTLSVTAVMLAAGLILLLAGVFDDDRVADS